MKLSATVNGRTPRLFDIEINDEEGLWVDREGIGPVAIFPDGSVYVYEEADSDADPMVVRTPQPTGWSVVVRTPLAGADDA